MLIIIYNIIQILLLLLLSPLLGVIILCTPKYRGRIGRRLGFRLKQYLVPSQGKVIWIHALSVGELSSARPLIHEIKKRFPEVFLVLSTTTRGGERFSGSMRDSVDLIIPFPIDLHFIVRKFISHIAPNLFILIETDYWPNFLNELQRQGVPSILANGRITPRSMRNYRRGRPFFKRLFGAFDVVAMQTRKDAENLVELGVEPGRVMTMGNLKYDNLTVGSKSYPISFGLPAGSPVIVAGSTHPGEEEIILRTFLKLLTQFSALVLVIAPRDVERGAAISQIAENYGIYSSMRSENHLKVSPGSLLVLDTLGELSSLYAEAGIVFVGGSLKKFGGHNPLEAAMHSKPIIFGPYMEDFQEIAADLLAVNGAKIVDGENELLVAIRILLENDALAREMGAYGAGLVREKNGAALRYAKIAGEIMGQAIK